MNSSRLMYIAAAFWVLLLAVNAITIVLASLVGERKEAVDALEKVCMSAILIDWALWKARLWKTPK